MVAADLCHLRYGANSSQNGEREKWPWVTSAAGSGSGRLEVLGWKHRQLGNKAVVVKDGRPPGWGNG